MKKKSSFFLAFALAVSLISSTAVYAASTTATKDIPIGGSGQMEMVGSIEPAILSVTMPSVVPFNISNSLTTENKVISPRIKMKNNSRIPVSITVSYTKVDISKLKNTTWCNNANVGPRQIAIGLEKEEVKDEMPTGLSQAKWLWSNQWQNMKVLSLGANQEDALYVVGTMGQDVVENATFSVTPTFIVSRTN